MPFTENIDQVVEFVSKVQAVDNLVDGVNGSQSGFKVSLLQDWTEEAIKRLIYVPEN